MSLDTDLLMERRRSRRQGLIWKVVAAVAITILAIVVVMDRSGGVAPFSGTNSDHIARLHVEGIIVEDRVRDELIEDLKANENVRAVIVYINSPGGTMMGGENLYIGLKALGEAKPVVAVMGSTATSAGYMTALGAERIYARDSSITGSIGVLMQTADLTEMLKKVGIEAITLKSGPFKAQPNPVEKMTKDVRAYTQGVVMEMHAMFVDMVALRRNLDRDEALALADGRIFTGRKAKTLGLIDGIGGEQEAVAWLKSEKKLAKDLDVIETKPDYPRPEFAERMLGMAGKALVSETLTLDGLLSVWQPRH